MRRLAAAVVRGLVPGLAATLAFTGSPSTAEACSPPQCWGGALTPANGATVPANLPSLHWQPVLSYTGDTPDPANVTLATSTAPNTPLPFSATPQADGTYLLYPDEPLQAGTTYVLTDGNACGDTPMPGPTSTFTVEASATPPGGAFTQLGTVTSDAEQLGTLDLGTSSGSCSVSVQAAYVDVMLALSAQALPWRDVLHYETRVDGDIWRAANSINQSTPPGESWQGRAVDRLYRVCGEPSDLYIARGLERGAHQVQFRAYVPGAPSTFIESDTLTVFLSCPEDAYDAGAGGGSGHGHGDDDGGCSVGGSPASSSVLLALLALGIMRRQRARSR